MGYCELSDVEVLNAKRAPYTDDSKPNIAQVKQMIENISFEIDAMLTKWGYTVPITLTSAPKTFGFLKHINALGAAGLADSSMFPEKVQPGETPHSGFLMTEYRRLLKFIDDAKGVVTPDIDTSLASIFSSFPILDASGNTQEPHFTMADDNW